MKRCPKCGESYKSKEHFFATYYNFGKHLVSSACTHYNHGLSKIIRGFNHVCIVYDGGKIR